MQRGSPGRVTWADRALALARRPFARDVGALGTAQVVVVVTSAVQGIVVARWLGPADYGLASLVMAYPTLLFSVFDAQSSAASIRYLTDFRRHADPSTPLAMVRLGHSVDAAIGATSFVLAVATGAWAATHVVHDRSLFALLLVYAAAKALNFPTNTNLAVLSVTDRLPLVARLQMLTTVVRSALILVFVAAGGGVAGVIWGGAISLVVDGAAFAIAGHVVARRTWGRSWLGQGLAPLDDRRREILTFIAYSDLSSLLALFAKEADLLLLGWYRGPREAGLYRLARALASVAGNAVAPLHASVYPRVASLVLDRDWRRLASSTRRYAWMLGLPLAALGALTIPLMPWLIRWTAGSPYADAVWPARLLVASSCLWVAFFWVRTLYFALDQLRAWTVIGAVGSALVVLGTVLVADRLGAPGVAAVQLAVLGVGGQIGTYLYIWPPGRPVPRGAA